MVVRVRRFSCTTRVPRTHCARSLSGVQMITRSTRASRAAISARGGQRIVGLELDHRPDHETRRLQRLFEQRELRQERRIDSGAGLVAAPQPVAERLDDVIGRDADVRRAGR